MTKTVDDFLATMGLVFSKRFETEDEQVNWYAVWCHTLRGFAPDVVKRAALNLVETRTKSTFPLPAEVRAECLRVIADEERSRPRLSFDPERCNPFALADSLVRGSMGRSAAMDDPPWAQSLWLFCAANKRLPNDREAQRLRDAAREFQRLRSNVEDMGPLAAPLSRLAQRMQEANIRRCEMILSAEAAQ